jgi:hypothetical protein
MKEINLRMLIRLYNGSRYLSNILPKMDELSGSDSNLFYITATTTTTTTTATKLLPEYDLNTTSILIDDIELDDHFKNDYRNWLETNVYSTIVTEEDDDDEEEDINSSSGSDDNDNENIIGTPLPDIIPKPITAEDLTREINKLYLEELQREFELKQEKQRQLELEKQNQLDGWDTPIIHPTNSRGSVSAAVTATASTSITTASVTAITTTNIDDDEGDEIEPEVDPLQGINWNSLTEEDLKKRLTLVEKKTVQRWLNIDMDDPRYIKVLNTFEGEILEDDEGWPI